LPARTEWRGTNVGEGEGRKINQLYRQTRGRSEKEAPKKDAGRVSNNPETGQISRDTGNKARTQKTTEI